jgi:sec-independent protein translocase protein TatA
MLNSLAMLGGQDLIIVMVVVLVLFGGKKIPELMRGVGQGMGELKKGMEEGQRQVQEAIRHEDPAPVVAPNPAPSVAATNPPAATSTPNSTPVP